MKKIIISFLLILVVGVLFYFNADSGKYKIKGTVRNKQQNGKMVYLRNAVNPSIVYDSTAIRNGRFSFSGKESEEAVVRELYTMVDNEYVNYLPVVLEPGTITVLLDSVVCTSGTLLNDKMQDFLLAKGKFYEEDFSDNTKEDIMQRFGDFLTKQIRVNSHSPVGKYIYVSYSLYLSEKNKKELLQLGMN